MPKQLRRIEITHKQELLQLVEEAQSDDQPLVLTKGTEDVAILCPIRRSARRATTGKVLTREDPLFSLVGIGQSNVPGGVSGKKHDYLLEAYRQKHA